MKDVGIFQTLNKEINKKKVSSVFIAFIFSISLTACETSTEGVFESLITSNPQGLSTEVTENSARIIFKMDAFRDIRDPAPSSSTQYNCLGDVLKVYKVTGGSFTGTPTEYDITSSDPFLPTDKPSFLNNVSVDLTFTHYHQFVNGTYLSDGCSYRADETKFVDICAEFDDPLYVVPSGYPSGGTITATPTPIYDSVTPGTWDEAYHNSITSTRFYRVRDYYCAGQGPIISGTIDQTKAYVGGVDVDINRSALGSHENMLMVLTYHSMGEEYADVNSQPLPPSPASGTNVFFEPADDTTILSVRLLSTGLDALSLLTIPQPRARYNRSPASVTTIVDELVTFYDPHRGIRTEFIEIPLSIDPLIDRIRIERVRGSFILYQMDLYRMGDRG